MHRIFSAARCSPAARRFPTARRFAEPRVFALAFLLVGCAPQGDYEISMKRLSPNYSSHLEPGASGQARFGGSMGMPSSQRQAPSNDGPREAPFTYKTPDGWEELAPTSMRVINMRPAGDERMECSFTLLGGDGGGLTANINRWRGQIGLDPIEDAEVESLRKGLLLGGFASIVDLQGSYVGMGDEPQDNWGLYGFVLPSDQFTVFVKMTGPADLIEQEKANLEDFCASITIKTQQHSADDGHNHGPDDGHNHSPGDGHDHAADGTDPHANVTPATSATVSSETGEFDFEMPAGWSQGPRKSMRVVNLTVGESECYIILLGGTGGGLKGNIDRWRGEVGMDPVSLAEIDAMPKVKILGSEAPLLEVAGNYQGMSASDGGLKRVLGVPLIRPGKSVFIKMVGPDAEVSAQRESFLNFVNSLSER